MYNGFHKRIKLFGKPKYYFKQYYLHYIHYVHYFCTIQVQINRILFLRLHYLILFQFFQT